MMRPHFTTLRPTDDNWENVVWPVAGVFGANASGKSTVLDALAYTRAVVSASASSWLDRTQMTRSPHLLDAHGKSSPSIYELDFVVNGVRYEYGFSVSARGIEQEWLHDVPGTRRRTLIDRDAHRIGDEVRIGRSATPSAALSGGVARRELVLSRAVQLEHPVLAPIAAAITDGIQIASYDEGDRAVRLQAIVEDVFEGGMTPDEVLLLLRAADIGIEGVEVREEDLPVALRELFERMGLAGSADKTRDGADAEHDDPNEGAIGIPDVRRVFLFQHSGSAGGSRALRIEHESAGTITWLSLAVPAVNALRRGSVLCVDEIDSSLHPQLCAALVGVFQDPALNRHGAQLVFTSHDSSLLSPTSEAGLQPEQIWFTEKGHDGAAELYSLADFSPRKDENHGRRYLAGRYGAVPQLVTSHLAALLDPTTAHPTAHVLANSQP